MSKHGKIVSMLGNQWNWDVQLKDAYAKGGQSAPTCAGCHMEYEGQYAHNMVRKIRWANYPFVPGIAENIKSEWSEARLDSWVVTCTQCHSERFARSYLDLMDKGTLAGLAKYQEAHAVVRNCTTKVVDWTKDQSSCTSTTRKTRFWDILATVLGKR
jgi:hydroxylamine dehydrogenase